MIDLSEKILKKNKKGVVEIQFHWIFVLIVGAIILIFFIALVNKQKDISVNRQNVQLAVDFDSIIKTSLRDKDTAYFFDFPELRSVFDCYDLIVEESTPKSFGNNIVFSPGFVEADKIVLLTKEANIGFPITNFVYVASPESKFYFFVDDSSEGRILEEEFNSLHEDLKVNKYGGTIFEMIRSDENLPYAIPDTLRIIFPSSMENPPDADVLSSIEEVSAVRINPGLMSADFYEYDEFGWRWMGTSYFFDDASFWGAVYENDINVFNCQINKVYDRFEKVKKVYRDKVILLINAYDTDLQNEIDESGGDVKPAVHDYYNSCINIYESALFVFDEIYNENNIMSFAETMDGINEALSLESCDNIY